MFSNNNFKILNICTKWAFIFQLYLDINFGMRENMWALSLLFVFMHLLKPWATNNAQEEEESQMHAFISAKMGNYP